ncbi:uncharacterized protein LOC114306046 isoform X3 [Camellia sinensis]|uniref:uncharacterized protein LOC114306046 isoform X3 n=1 Tax=Camellia sinensis TaxID=4442 RepID=UPI0010364042|nr:uncharacterized protein LOC114306046 isoform X3 [Camellia sinensis]
MVRFSFFFINGFLIIFIAERQSRVAIVVKATGESSESSTSLSVVKSVQNVEFPLLQPQSFHRFLLNLLTMIVVLQLISLLIMER